MKRFLTTVITFICIVAMMVTPANADSGKAWFDDNEDDIVKNYFGAIEEASQYCQEVTQWNIERDSYLVWTIYSLQQHKFLQKHFYYKNDTIGAEIMNAIDDPNIDFIQFGALMSEDEAVPIQKELQNDATNVVDIILPVGENGQIFKQKILERNIPIWWKIEKNDINNNYVFEVAIGKYQINRGDTLSEIALAYDTTVERLLELNSNIVDPNLVYAGDYLVIK